MICIGKVALSIPNTENTGLHSAFLSRVFFCDRQVILVDISLLTPSPVVREKNMDCVEWELSRIIRLAERELGNVNWSQICRPLCEDMTSQEGVPSTTKSFYSEVRSRVIQRHDQSGDSALHWFLGTHAPTSAVENVLEMMNRSENSMEDDGGGESFHETRPIRSRTARGATPLHVAAYRNSWYVESIVNLLTDSKYSKDTGLASIPMSCGSYPLHVLCGHNATINENVLKQLLKADPSVVWKEDKNGDNPFSLLWKNVLRFRWATSKEKGLKDTLDGLDGGLSWMTIIGPDKFLSYCLQMMRAFRNVTDLSKSKDQNEWSIHELCRIPRCPPLLLRLALTKEYARKFGISGDAFSLDEYGMLPIHHAVQFLAADERFVPQYLKGKLKSVVEILLDEYPESVMVTDIFYRLPLHYALESGRLEQRILLKMIQLYPDSIRVQDPVSGLFPFMLASSSSRLEVPRKDYDHNHDDDDCDGKGSCSLNSREWKQHILPMSFLLLQMCPEVVKYQYQESPSRRSLNV